MANKLNTYAYPEMCQFVLKCTKKRLAAVLRQNPGPAGGARMLPQTP